MGRLRLVRRTGFRLGRAVGRRDLSFQQSEASARRCNVSGGIHQPRYERLFALGNVINHRVSVVRAERARPRKRLGAMDAA